MKDNDKILTVDELYRESDPKKLVDNLIRQNIRLRLADVGKTQKWLAAEVHKSEPYLSQYLAFNGKGLATLLSPIAKALGISPYDLVRTTHSEEEEEYLEAIRQAKALGMDRIIKEHLFMLQERIKLEQRDKPPGPRSSSVA